MDGGSNIDLEETRAELLRARAIHKDAISGVPTDLGAIWRSLLSGNERILDRFDGQRRHYLLLEAGSGIPLPERTARILERALLGSSQKCAAFEFGLSVSTIAMTVKQAFGVLGLRCVGSRAPILMVLAAHAAEHPGAGAPARACEFELVSARYRVVSSARPDNRLLDLLSPAVMDVTRLRVEGKSYATIAALRNSSRRTVANQVAAAFKELHVSGRAELLTRLASWQG